MASKSESIRVDLLNLEIDSLDFDEKPEVSLICSYYSMGRAHRCRIAIKISTESKMLDGFYTALLGNLRSKIDDVGMGKASDYSITNRERLDNELKDFFLKIKIGAEKGKKRDLSDFEYAMISTNRLDFYNPDFSLNNKSLKEKVNILLKKSRADIQDKFYVPARVLLEKILILDRENKEALALIGACQRELGEYEKAEQAFRRWLELSEPDDPRPYFNYGDILLRLKKYSIAEEIFESYLKIFPDDFDGLMELAQLKYLKGVDYMPQLEAAHKADRELFGKEIMANFIFSKVRDSAGEQLDIKLAAALLGIQPEIAQNFVDDGIIPHEVVDDDTFFNVNEIEEWTKVMNHFSLLSVTIQFDEEAAQKLEAHRIAISENIKLKAAIKKRKKLTSRQKKKIILEDLGQRSLFNDEK